MKVQDKQQIVTDLAGKLGGASAFYLTDFTGLSVKKITDLRARLRNAGVECIVVKNTLAERALAGLELPDIGQFFKGPTALVIGRNDAIAAAKVLSDFAREHDNKPTVKAGIVERRAVGPQEVTRLATLPPREQLLAELAGALEAPLAQLAYVLQARLYEFAGLLDALRTSREEA
ncbi:MAG: 50S ribosomal protein L10 [Gemmatimonadetes bacterium]|nr:50S ribosomal protein L10 [Gemmatimonadota bacterium]